MYRFESDKSYVEYTKGQLRKWRKIVHEYDAALKRHYNEKASYPLYEKDVKTIRSLMPEVDKIPKDALEIIDKGD